MKPSHKNHAPAAVAVVAAVALVAAAEIAAVAVASKPAPRSSRCRRGASTEALPSRHTSFLVPHIQFVVANDIQSVATPLVTTSDRLHPHTSRLRQLSRPTAVVVTPIREQRY